MLTPAAQYLTYAEAVMLYQQLQASGVDALVKTGGPPTFPFGEGMYYQLLIEETDTVAARAVVEAFELQRATSLAPRCPRCGTPDPVPVLRLAWWKRLFYVGTTLHECRSCGAEFPR
ncbi:hypothetical protein K3G63_03760 [Hymenobacter sp. HSC-4F20]|uniref:hypothetical protein n=1 Tax=Hymenobacter sp. HSC-4F20 TaxID=2864135 RepID=UPI001C73D91A|nr:hypothetical protein [Hymenobacter sp. HSC-4F20]MBX0289537.1 hypothetical protein [Hymenobacter sp. HSC-4F20]